MKKGTLKSKKTVHFNDQNLTEVKIFKSTDEPNAPNISHEEYMKIQEEVRKNPHIFKIEEIRKKEITMDINQQKEPEIEWKFPTRIKLELDIETELNELGKESQEKKNVQDICDSQLRVRYFDKIQEPSELQNSSKMFSFTDETIPKIENSQIATKTNDVSIADVSLFWENISQKKITEEDLSKLKELLEKAVEINEDYKQQILDIAQKKYEQGQMNPNYANPNNNININNNLTINNNQRILSMNNYPPSMNFNPMNQVQNPALNLINNINNIKQFPQNIDQNNILSQNYQALQNTLQTSTQNIGINPLNIPNINMNYPFDQNIATLNQLNNFQQQMQNNIIPGNNTTHQKQNFDQRMILESAQRMNLSKYKTKPCRNYHSSTGCTRGDNCFFIHDPNYKGREIQNFDPRNYERDFPLQIQNFVPQGIIPGLGGFGNQFNIGQLGMGMQSMMGFGRNMGINNLNNNIGQQGGNEDMNQQNKGMNLQGYDFSYGMQGQNNGN